MDDKKSNQRTLTNDLIRVSEDVKSVTDILRAAKPYLDVALKKMADRDLQSCDPIEVPPGLFRDLVLIVASETKKAHAFVGVGLGGVAGSGDENDDDWNPFGEGGMNFPDFD